MTGVIETVVVWSILVGMGGGTVARKVYKKIKAKRAKKIKAKIEKRRAEKYFKTVIEIESKEICTICQDDFAEDNEQAILYCGHKYHPCCINEWMKHKKTCPLCNMALKSKSC